MRTNEADRFIYIVGEQQEGIIPEQAEVIDYTKASMNKIDTTELALVIANVFGRGQFFPGPDSALAAVIHEFVARSERYKRRRAKLKKGRCTLVTAFKRLDGDITVKVTAVLPVRPGALVMEQPDTFHHLLIDSLPDFQDALTEEAYAPDSKLIGLIKEATLHHIHSKLQ